MEVLLEAKTGDPNSRLQLMTSRKGVIWFDQISVMPLDTYKVCIVQYTHRESLSLRT